MTQWNEETKNSQQQTRLKIQTEEVNQKILAKEQLLKRYRDSFKQFKQNRATKIMKENSKK